MTMTILSFVHDLTTIISAQKSCLRDFLEIREYLLLLYYMRSDYSVAFLNFKLHYIVLPVLDELN